MRIDNKILTELIEYGIVDMDSVLDNYMNAKRSKIKKLHNYAITPPQTDGGRWQTCYRDKDGKRKNIKAPTEEELLDKLIYLYSSQSYIEKLDFYSLFVEWLDYKKSITNSINTIRRHEQHYKKYLQGSKLHKMKIDRIDDLLLEKEANRIVREYNLTSKEWVNVKTVIKGMFEYAQRKKYISDNPVPRIKVMVKFRQVVKKTGKTETYNTEELKALNRYLDEMYAATSDLSFLAVKLNFLLGLRVGELVALKWTDRTDLSHLHIVREEIRNQETGQLEVVEHTKTNTDRFVVLVPKAILILQKIKEQSRFHNGYIFTRDSQRITSRQIAYVLEKYAERKNLPTKSTHKMRKTYASNLNAKGVPLDCIREQLGHSNLSTTLGYIYNPLTEKETYQLMTKAL